MQRASRDLQGPSMYNVDLISSKMTWGPYFWFHMWRAATSTISACDYLGERMASLFGITSAKYQYAIDEYYRMKKEREEEKEENRLSEEAERSFDRQLNRDFNTLMPFCLLKKEHCLVSPSTVRFVSDTALKKASEK
uniref:Family with sequence similarity 177 member A1 n=1 Tax=Sphaeramia orbicularis TaxID=375764 RepID=A0A672ZC17_9TELE